jgi:hypothetical protein
MDLDKNGLNNPAAKRSLEMGELHDTDKGILPDIDIPSGTAMLVKDGNNDVDLPKGEVEKDISKRTKKDGANSPSLGSAESREGSVRSQ